jgi:glycosyltransferase involved in cell wall biosynthesis
VPVHLVVPYPATNSTVRARGLHWIERAVAAGRVDRGNIEVHGPGFSRARVRPGTSLLLLRNARRITRGHTEARLLKRASLGVYDLDDGLPWDNGALPGLGHWTKRPFPRSLVARRAAQAADRVVVGNDVLAEWAVQYCTDVRVVPTCVEPNEYRVRDSWEISDPPTLGWIGSAATEVYLRSIAGPLGEIHRRTGARLVVISGPGELAPELVPFTERSVWSADSVRMIADWDIGLMPLRDGPYERAKCGYKLLQYAVSGVPAVGSPVGINRRLLDAMQGLAPATDDDWVDAVTTVLTEPATRRAERAAAGLSVARTYSYEAWQDEFLDAVEWAA